MSNAPHISPANSVWMGFQHLMDANIIGMAVTDSAGIVDANDTLLKFLEYTREDLKAGKLTWARILPDFKPEDIAERMKVVFETGRFGPADRDFLTNLGRRKTGQLSGTLLDHDKEHWVCFIADLSEGRRAQWAARFLAEAGRVLASSLDYNTTLQSIAHLAVPELADWCSVDIIENGQPRTLAVAHKDPAKLTLSKQWNERWPPDWNAITGSPNVMRTGMSELYREIPAEIIEPLARDAEHLRVIRELQFRSAIVVPLTARGHTFGAISFITTGESERRYDEKDLAIAEELGRRAGLAVDNARLYKDLSLSEERMTFALKAADMAAWSVEFATHETFVSPEYYKLYGLPCAPEKWEFSDFYKLIHPDDLDRVKDIFYETLDSRAGYSTEFRVVWPDKSVHWVRAVGRATVRDGQVAGVSGILIDIDEQKRGESILLESEERFRILAEAMPQMVWTAEPDGHVDYYNQRWIQFTGVHPSESVNFFSEVIHPEQYPVIQRQWEDCLRTTRIFEAEYQIRDREGQYRWYLGRAIPSRNARGEVLKWFGTCTNIDSHKRQEDRLVKLQAITAALSRAVTPGQVADVFARHALSDLGARGALMATLASDQTTVEIVSSVGPRPTGTVRTFNVNDPRIPVCDAIARQTPIFLDSLSEMIARYPFQEEGFKREGYGSICMVPLVFQGRTLGALAFGYASENTFSGESKNLIISIAQASSQALERARLFESELVARHRSEESQHRLSFLADASRLLSETLDYRKSLQRLVNQMVPRFADGAIIDVVTEGDKLERLAVAYVDRSIEKTFFEIARSPVNLNEESHPFIKVLKRKKTYVMGPEVARFVEKVGQYRGKPYDTILAGLGVKSGLVVPLFLGDRSLGLITLFTTRSGRIFTRQDADLTEEVARRTAIALENARLFDEVQKAVSVRDEFLSIASHELKTPLTSIKLQLQIVKRLRKLHDLQVDSRLNRALEVFDSQADRLAKLVDSLLDISRIQAGRLSIEPEQVNLSELIRHLIERIPAQVSNSRCEVQLDIEDDVVGYWDRLRLEQVVLNLMTNAFKYGTEHPVQVRAYVENDKAVITVQDFGIGIAKEDQVRIFDRFERAVSDRTTWGLGLGLYITRQIVEAHHGHIRVESELGKGSTFIVELPLHPFSQVLEQPQDHRTPTTLH